jgi:hypothetical protein
MLKFDKVVVVNGVLYVEYLRKRPVPLEMKVREAGGEEWEPDNIHWPLAELEEQQRQLKESMSLRACTEWALSQFKQMQRDEPKGDDGQISAAVKDAGF